ncbi:MAG: ribonuclease R family protein [Planctomycetota bacterium]
MASSDEQGGGSFKSFKDLLKAKGGGEEEPPKDEQEGPGWTLETQDELNLDDLPELEDVGSLDRVRARPPAAGPMTHGPVPYGDPESEEMQLLLSFRCRTTFPDDVLAEVGDLPDDPDPAQYGDRVDLRGETIFTIDGDDAKDYDDAIGIRVLENGNHEVGVHIADVGHYVRPGTALDDEALARATSVYVPGQVVPMLPQSLSNGLCSLVPHRDRFAYSVIMEFDPGGKRVAARVHKSVIKSVHRNTYRIVQELLDGVESEETAAIAFLREPLQEFQLWTKKQQAIRDAKGSMRIQSTEKKFVFNDEHEVVEIVDAPRYFSQALIEETALAANQAVGDLFRERGLPTIYRVHPEKDPDEVAAVAKALEEHGIRVPKKDRLTGRDIGDMIRFARRRPNAEALIQRIMGLVERAIYEVKDHEDVAEHWGLARKAYLHFTSPIRRYPDLVVHRWLNAIESRGDDAADELKAEAFLDDLNEVAAHCSMRAELAGMTETAVKDLKVCQFMEPHIDEVHEAKIVRVSRYGLVVHLPEFNVAGFVPAKTIGERPQLKGPTLTLHAGKRAFSFTEGFEVRVEVKDVDFIKLQVLLELKA